jgi:hypothetical protein
MAGGLNKRKIIQSAVFRELVNVIQIKFCLFIVLIQFNIKCFFMHKS